MPPPSNASLHSASDAPSGRVCKRNCFDCVMAEAGLELHVYRSAAEGDLPKVRKWLRAAAVDARCLEAGGSCLLHAASVGGRLHVVSELLEQGASVDARNSDGGTALMEACLCSHHTTALLLLEHSASIDLQSVKGGTALMCAASSGHKGIVAELLCRGARVDLRDIISGTCLMHAASQGHSEVLQLLLAHGHDSSHRSSLVDTQDDLGQSALTCAAARGHESCVRLLLQAGADTGRRTGANLTALQLAVAHGHVATARLIWEQSGELIEAAEAAMEELVGRAAVPRERIELQKRVQAALACLADTALGRATHAAKEVIAEVAMAELLAEEEQQLQPRSRAGKKKRTKRPARACSQPLPTAKAAEAEEAEAPAKVAVEAAAAKAVDAPAPAQLEAAEPCELQTARGSTRDSAGCSTSPILDEYSCPITTEIMKDPVVTADGFTYERDAIAQWLEGHGSSPVTGAPLDSKVLIPNHALRKVIRDFEACHC